MTRAYPARLGSSSIKPPGSRIVVSSISLAELVYLIEKNRLPDNAYTDLKAVLHDPDHVFKEAPFTVEIVEDMKRVPRADVPDMPDRIVAATAVYFGVPVISRDGKIRSSNVQTIWSVIFLKSTGAQDISSTGEAKADFSKSDKPMPRSA